MNATVMKEATTEQMDLAADCVHVSRTMLSDALHRILHAEQWVYVTAIAASEDASADVYEFIAAINNARLVLQQLEKEGASGDL